MRLASFRGREEGFEMSGIRMGHMYDLNESGIMVVGTLLLGSKRKQEGYLVREDEEARCYRVENFSISPTEMGLRARNPIRFLLDEEQQIITDKILQRAGL